MPFPFAALAIQAGQIIATYAVNYLLRRFGERPKPPLAQGSWPETADGKTIPVVFGYRWVPAQILWYGNARTSKVVNGSLTIGYKYYAGVHWGVCHAPVTALWAIRANGVYLWGNDWGPDVFDNPTSPITSSDTVAIVKPNAFGGEYQGGGVQGLCDIEFGDGAQTQNAYLEAQQGGTGNQPAYRGILAGVYRDNDPTPKAGLIAAGHFEIRQWEFLVSALYGNAPQIGGVAPTEIIEQAWTNQAWGCGAPAASLDTTSFAAAAATLASEGLYMSLLWDTSGPVEDLLKKVVAHIQGVLYVRHTDGKVVLKLIRDDYDPDDLLELDESNVTSVEAFSRPDLASLPNTLVATYQDSGGADAVYRGSTETSLTLHNPALLAAASYRPNAVQMDYEGLVEASIVEAVAVRDLRRLSAPLATATIIGNRELAALNPGDAFKLSWDAYGVDELIMRVNAIDYGSITEGEVRIDAVEDVYGAAMSTGAGSSRTSWTSPMRTVISQETTPPADPDTGDSYLVGDGATGDWSGHDGEIATWDGDSWEFTVPEEGELVLVEEETQAYRYNEDGDWEAFVDGSLVRWPVGTWDDPWLIGATPDFSAMWRHATGKLMYKSAAVPTSDDDGVEFGFGSTVETIP